MHKSSEVVAVVATCLKPVLRQVSCVVALVVLNKRQPTTDLITLLDELKTGKLSRVK